MTQFTDAMQRLNQAVEGDQDWASEYEVARAAGRAVRRALAGAGTAASPAQSATPNISSQAMNARFDALENRLNAVDSAIRAMTQLVCLAALSQLLRSRLTFSFHRFKTRRLKLRVLRVPM